jgi:two-component system, NarL family, response regulator NreC
LNKIVLCDDHPLIRAGLRVLLNNQTDCHVVGETDNGKDVPLLIREFQPDILITDLMIPGGPGQEVIRKTKLTSPRVKIIVLSMHNSDEYVRGAFAAGADAYVTKDAPAQELVQAIHEVMAQRQYLSPTLTPPSAEDLEKIPVDPLKPVTPRERQVLLLAAEGLTSVEISKQLFISSRTAETHRANLMRKLGLHSQTDLVHFAFRTGLLVLSR